MQYTRFATSATIAVLLACATPREPATDTAHSAAGPQPPRTPWDDARSRGVEFRAIGQEPGWMLEIDEEKSMYLLADYGEKKITMPAPAARDSAGVRIYDSGTATHHVTVRITPVACQDVMSGEEMTHTVTVILDSTQYNGCGRVLRP